MEPFPHIMLCFWFFFLEYIFPYRSIICLWNMNIHFQERSGLLCSFPLLHFLNQKVVCFCGPQWTRPPATLRGNVQMRSSLLFGQIDIGCRLPLNGPFSRWGITMCTMLTPSHPLQSTTRAGEPCGAWGSWHCSASPSHYQHLYFLPSPLFSFMALHKLGAWKVSGKGNKREGDSKGIVPHKQPELRDTNTNFLCPCPTLLKASRLLPLLGLWGIFNILSTNVI